MNKPKNPQCPKCKSEEVVRIVYGLLPLEKAKELSAEGNILAGCMVNGDDPVWSCKACEHRFGRFDEK